MINHVFSAAKICASKLSLVIFWGDGEIIKQEFKENKTCKD
jgi:hypothetical protein